MQDVKATLEFTSVQVQEILAQYVKENYPLLRDAVDAKAIQFNVSAGFNGHGGHSGSQFNGAKVEVRLKQAFKPDR